MGKNSHLLLACITFFGCAGVSAQTIQLSANSSGKQFDGIGAVNGGGATSVLLKDYPEPQRSQILDMVYKPQFGASVSTILVEVPGDGNSTQGSMPSHSHFQGDHNYLRGYMWWVMKEARRRNAALSLDATAWSAPAWVGNFWSDDMVDYYVDWLQGLREVHGMELDALGCHNEKGWNADFAKHLRRAMNERGFHDVKLHGFGNWGEKKMEFLQQMQEDPELAEALDAVCAHTFSEIQLSAEQRKMAEDLGKPIWNSEDHVYLPGFDCLITIVKCFNQNYIVSGATKVINWYDIGATYPLEPYSQEPPMLIAQEPWSGHYHVRQALWGYAHYGQFTRVGWRYIDDGCLNLPGGGSMVTMRDPQTGDYSIIAETKGAKKTQTIKVKVSDGLSANKLCVWYSDAHQQFVRLKDITPKDGSFSVTLKPDAVYSLSTTTGQQKGMFTDIPASKPFPIPYEDDFERYENPAEWGYLPHYLADLIGCFELVEAPLRKGFSLRQTVGAHTLSWAPEWHHYTILGDAEWADYEISADVYLNPGDEAGVMGRLCDVGSGYGIWAKGYYLKMDNQGKVTLILTCGKKDPKELIGDKEQQAIILARKDVEAGGEYTIAETIVSGIAAQQWHNLKLRFDGNQITGFVDGVEVVRANSDHYGKGMAGLIAPLQEHRVSTPYFDNMKITPLGCTQAIPATKQKVQPLYAVGQSAQAFPNFKRMHFGCDGNSITAGQQWSKTVVEQLGFATHHNVAVGSATWACHSDTQDYGAKDFAGISDGWLSTEDKAEIQKRHNNTSKVHIQKFIAEVDSGFYPEPDVFVFAMGINDSRLGSAEEALKGKSLSDVDVTTMAGGARWSIQTIIERFPNCRVFVCTPIQTAHPDHNEMNLKKIEILREICRSLSVQLIDCYGESGITEKLENGHGRRYLRDGLHPAEKGQQLMGRYIAKEIRNNLF